MSRALVGATSDEERERAVEAAVTAWAQAREDLLAAVPGMERLADPDKFRAWLNGQIERGVEASALADAVEQRFLRVAALAAGVREPGGWADRWRAAGPVVADDEVRARIARASEATARAAASTGEAVRQVLAARRDGGVPLYATYAAGLGQRYLAAVAAADLDLNVAVPQAPPPPAQGSVWGTFQVRSHLPPETAASVFAEAPPLPPRPEMLQARSVPARLGPLQADGASDDGADE